VTFGLTGTPRDPYKQPFAVDSIWNMPIGSGAQYVAAGLPAIPGGSGTARVPMADWDQIVMKPTAPLTQIRYSSAAWTGANRCGATSSQVLATVPMPSNFIAPNTNRNESAAFLAADGRTIVQVQPLARCSTGSYATAVVRYPDVDLYGDGIRGSHGGAGMSAIGGTLRVGELRPGMHPPRHALKVNVYSYHELYNCSNSDRSDCYRWPAPKADGHAVARYGAGNNNRNFAMRMGALLAIPPTRDINAMGLRTEPAKQIAWTLQNYGAYIVDDTYSTEFAIETEVGPDGNFTSQFRNDYGTDFETRNQGSNWSRDIQAIRQALMVVNNNSPTSIGGGGTPRQPLAAPISP
jgi:hypothetical protein